MSLWNGLKTIDSILELLSLFQHGGYPGEYMQLLQGHYSV